MIKVGIIGATGYAGGELVRLLLSHPSVEIKWLSSKSYVDQKYASIYCNMFELVPDICKADELESMADEVDVIFTATPQGYLGSLLTESVLNKTKIIDLSADFRMKDIEIYEQWYQIKHLSPQFINEAVYGLCELHRNEIKKTRLLANPGCYTTCSILSAYPLVKENFIDTSTLIFDAKSGTSGAGRNAKTQNLFCEVNENIKAYAVTTHRHTPEIEEQLSYAACEDVKISFTPHLVPMNRGILVTAYADLKKKADGMYPTKKEIREAYLSYYKKEVFIRVLDENVFPETKWVKGSNFVDVNFIVDERLNRVIMMGALDNLVKGAAGQAVQNMNIMFGLKETDGLFFAPIFP